MFEENLVLLRTHQKNIQRYRQLLETSLTDFEREYIGKRLSEEQLAIEMLSAKVPSAASSPDPRPTTLQDDLRDLRRIFSNPA